MFIAETFLYTAQTSIIDKENSDDRESTVFLRLKIDKPPKQ